LCLEFGPQSKYQGEGRQGMNCSGSVHRLITQKLPYYLGPQCLLQFQVSL